MARLLSLRDIVSKAAMEIGITQSPITQAIGARDQDVIQMMALLSAVADDLLDEEPYSLQLGDGMWIEYPDGTRGDEFTTDGDLILFDGRLAVMGVKFRFKREKGFEYGEDMRDFLTRQQKLAHRMNAKVIDVDEDAGRII